MVCHCPYRNPLPAMRSMFGVSIGPPVTTQGAVSDVVENDVKNIRCAGGGLRLLVRAPVGIESRISRLTTPLNALAMIWLLVGHLISSLYGRMVNRIPRLWSPNRCRPKWAMPFSAGDQSMRVPDLSSTHWKPGTT